jgi:hypothetical protein
MFLLLNVHENGSTAMKKLKLASLGFLLFFKLNLWIRRSSPKQFKAPIVLHGLKLFGMV